MKLSSVSKFYCNIRTVVVYNFDLLVGGPLPEVGEVVLARRIEEVLPDRVVVGQGPEVDPVLVQTEVLITKAELKKH